MIIGLMALQGPAPRLSLGTPNGTAHALAWAAERKEGVEMLDLLWVLAAVFIVLWILGVSLSVNVGAFIHILLVLAVISVLVRIIMGRRVI